MKIRELSFAYPYPILISGSDDGTITVFGLKNCNREYRNKPIIKFFNVMDVEQICFMPNQETFNKTVHTINKITCMKIVTNMEIPIAKKAMI